MSDLRTVVATLEQKVCNDDRRIGTIETALWGENRDGEGGIVNKLNAIITKGTMLAGLMAFVGGAIGPYIIPKILKAFGLGS